MSRFTDMSFRWQLLTAFGFVLLVTAAATTFGLLRLAGAAHAYAQLRATTLEALIKADDANVQFTTRHKVLEEAFLFSVDPARVQRAIDETTTLDRDVQASVNTLRTGKALLPNETQLIQSAVTAFGDYQVASQTAIARILAGGDPMLAQQEAAQIVNGKDRPISAALHELANTLEVRATAESANIESDVNRTLPVIFAIMLAALMAGVGIALLYARYIAREVGEVARAARGLAQGDIDQTLTVRSENEIGQMADSFREMIAYQKEMAALAETVAAGDTTRQIEPKSDRDVLGNAFQTLLASQRQMAGVAEAIASGDLTQRIEPKSERDVLGNAFARMVNNLRELTTQIREDMAQLATSSRQILDSTAEHASGATEQSAAITETTSTIQQVKTSAEQVADQAQVVSESAQKVSHVAQQGVDAVHHATDGMLDIRERVHAVAENILALSEQTQQIGEIITAVSDLADQSNLLALNAAIEASRAGEQGKGFSVVAAEIRTLAEQSKAATVQVRAILQDIQRATNAAVMAMEQGSKGVEAGMGTIEEAGRTMEELADVVEPAAQAAVQISVAVQQHTVGMEQIATAMNHISQATTQNLQAARNNQTAAEGLDGLAGRLNQLVAQYRV